MRAGAGASPRLFGDQNSWPATLPPDEPPFWRRGIRPRQACCRGGTSAVARAYGLGIDVIARTVILPETLEGYTVRYGMPSYESEAEVALRAAGSPSSSTCGPVPDQYRDGFPTSGIGTGGVLLSSAKQIGLSLIERMARDSVESAAPIR